MKGCNREFLSVDGGERDVRYSPVASDHFITNEFFLSRRMSRESGNFVKFFNDRSSQQKNLKF